MDVFFTFFKLLSEPEEVAAADPSFLLKYFKRDINSCNLAVNEIIINCVNMLNKIKNRPFLFTISRSYQFLVFDCEKMMKRHFTAFHSFSYS